MGENIAKLIDSHFSESIDMSEEQVLSLFCILSFFYPFMNETIYKTKITFVLGLTSSFVQDEFSGVITRALSTLVLGLETRLEVELANMARLPWATLEGVGDQSEYVFLTKTSMNIR